MTETAALLYIRVSKEEQVRFGYSLEAQEDRLRAYCLMQGLDVAGVFREEGVSASKVRLDRRKVGAQLLEALDCKEGMHVIALKLDRLFRSTIDCLNTVKRWEKQGVAVHFVDMGGASINTSTAIGKMFLTMAAAFAEMESNLIGERTRAALAVLKKKGIKLGGKRDCADLRTPMEIQVLAVNLWNVHGYSLGKIGRYLKKKGYRTTRGNKKWSPQTVQRILQRGGVDTSARRPVPPS